MQNETLIYRPPNSITLDKVEVPQIRLGIQGFPGEGKTWAALTFPNPIVMDLDRGLGAHRGKADVISLPFYDPTFGKQYYPAEPDNMKLTVLAWLNKEGKNLTKDQTLVFDGLTGIEYAYHNDWKRHPVVSSRSGKIDDLAEWGLKHPYFDELFNIFKTLKCHVVMLTHEAEKKDKPVQMGVPGEYTGKIRPLMSGAVVDKIVGNFTDWFRALSANKPDFDKLKTDTKAIDGIRKNWNMTLDEFKSVCDSYPRNTIYYWQTEGDDIFSGKCSSLVNFPRYIPANYNSFIKYLRK